MGEGTDRVKEIAQEIDELRNEMTPLITELDRRRRDALDWKLQVQQHVVPVTVVALALLGVTGYAIWSSVHDRRERHRPVVKARNLRLALSRMMDEPQRVAPPEPSGMRALTSVVVRTAVTAAATIVVRRAVERFADATKAGATPAPVRPVPAYDYFLPDVQPAAT